LHSWRGTPSGGSAVALSVRFVVCWRIFLDGMGGCTGEPKLGAAWFSVTDFL